MGVYELYLQSLVFRPPKIRLNILGSKTRSQNRNWGRVTSCRAEIAKNRNFRNDGQVTYTAPNQVVWMTDDNNNSNIMNQIATVPYVQ